jgi:Methyltransferase domain
MLDPRFPLHWQMSRPERLAIVAVLEQIKPRVSIEIGTYEGGSLQVISAYSEKVFSLDLDPAVGTRLAGRFSNVEFLSGDSKIVLPDLVSRLNASGETPEFVLIDGSHYTEGVRSDIESLLRLKPARDVVILMHDSFNPNCRKAMREAAWADCPYVHEVELDLIPGNFSAEQFDTAELGSMWSGLGCAIMSPTPRTGPLVVREWQREVFDAVLPISRHAAPQTTMAGRIKRALTSTRRETDNRKDHKSP